MRAATIPAAFTRRLLNVAQQPREQSDRELLGRFAANRDEDAFTELVRRHGRMVLAVARRVTGSPQDAEDAFQAAFMVLARRATHIRQPEQLANWLYGVAYRTALEARAARRRVLEHPVSAVPETSAPLPSDDTSELRQVIDEELACLPDKYRAAVVLCDLEGLPRSVAAARLKIPEGTLSSRLAHARKVLAGRLTRRGIVSTAGGLASLFTGESMRGALPQELVVHTARAAARAGTGGLLQPDLVSPSVSHLTEGVMKIMLANRLRMSLSALVLVVGLFTLGAIGLAQQFQPAPAQTPTVNQPLRNAGQSAAPAREAPKFIARGIEDEDVPYGNLPTQAVVRLENGKLIIRRRVEFREPVTHQRGNQTVTTYEHSSTVTGYEMDASDIAVFDMKGNRLMPKTWKEKLKTDVHVLLAYDGKLPNPRELTLLKEDTLMVILPASSLTPVPPAPTADGIGQPYFNYTPVTTYVPQTTYVPRTTYTLTPSTMPGQSNTAAPSTVIEVTPSAVPSISPSSNQGVIPVINPQSGPSTNPTVAPGQNSRPQPTPAPTAPSPQSVPRRQSSSAPPTIPDSPQPETAAASTPPSTDVTPAGQGPTPASNSLPPTEGKP